MEESKKVNTEHFKKKIGNTTYRVRVHFPQNTKRTFTDSVNTLIMNECTSKKEINPHPTLTNPHRGQFTVCNGESRSR